MHSAFLFIYLFLFIVPPPPPFPFYTQGWQNITNTFQYNDLQKNTTAHYDLNHNQQKVKI